MTCDAIRERLCERLDAELGAAAQSDVEAHLAGCAACRDVAAGLVRVLEDLALLSDIPIPHGLGERMAARVPSPVAFGARRRAPTHDFRRVAGWAAVMIAMSFVLVDRDFTGRVADGIAPVLAEARQQALKSELRDGSLVARLDARAGQGLERLAAAAFDRER